MEIIQRIKDRDQRAESRRVLSCWVSVKRASGKKMERRRW